MRGAPDPAGAGSAPDLSHSRPNDRWNGTIRDYVTGQRRPYLRFFACEQDLSHESPDEPLPAAVARGAEPFLVIGALAGG